MPKTKRIRRRMSGARNAFISAWNTAYSSLVASAVLRRRGALLAAGSPGSSVSTDAGSASSVAPAVVDSGAADISAAAGVGSSTVVASAVGSVADRLSGADAGSVGAAETSPRGPRFGRASVSSSPASSWTKPPAASILLRALDVNASAAMNSAWSTSPWPRTLTGFLSEPIRPADARTAGLTLSVDADFLPFAGFAAAPSASTATPKRPAAAYSAMRPTLTTWYSTLNGLRKPRSFGTRTWMGV